MRKTSHPNSPYIHASQTVIYTQQYFINTQSPTSFQYATSPLQALPSYVTAPAIGYGPTLVSYPVATAQGSTQITTYLPGSSTSWGGPLTTSTNAPLLLAPPMPGFCPSASAAFSPLNAYRFPPLPPPAMTTSDKQCRITELAAGEGEGDENIGDNHDDELGAVNDNGEVDDSDDHYSETEISLLDDGDDETSAQFVQLGSTYRFPQSGQLQSQGTAAGSCLPEVSNRSTKTTAKRTPPSSTPTAVVSVSPSVLLLRKSSSCPQPLASPPRKKQMRRTKPKHACRECNQVFSRAHDLKRHSTIHSPLKAYPCQCCSKAFGRKDALKRHMQVRGKYHDDNSRKAPPKSRVLSDKLSKDLPVGLKNPVATLPTMPTMPSGPAQMDLPVLRVEIVASTTSKPSIEQSQSELPSRPFKVSEIVPQASISSRASSAKLDDSPLQPDDGTANSWKRKGSLLPPTDGLQLGLMAESDISALMMKSVG